MKKLFAAILLSLCAFGASAQFTGGVFSGRLLAPNGSASQPGISFRNDTDTGIWLDAGPTMRITINGTNSFGVNNSAIVNLPSATAQLQLFGDTILSRDAANTLALRNSTNPQEYRVYRSFVDAANYERIALRWTGTSGVIETVGAGTQNTPAPLALGTAGTTRVTIPVQNALRFSSFTFANIATHLTTNGEIGYCSDCTIANPCAGAGTGAFAKRLNGVNVCN